MAVSERPSDGFVERKEGTLPAEFCYRRNLRTKKFEYLTPLAARVIGSEIDHILRENTKQTVERIHPDDRQAVVDCYRRLMEQGSGLATTEFRILRNDGTFRWLRHTAELQTDEKGEPCILMGVVVDITEAREVQAHLEELRIRYEALWQRAKLAVCQSTIDGRRLVSCNERWARLTGYNSVEECNSRCVPSEVYVDPEVRARMMRLVTESPAEFETEAQIKRGDGTVVWLHLSFCRRGQGDTVDVVGTDITVRRLLTHAEIDVLRHLMAGMNNKEIALKLSRSLRTVENHRASVMSKLGVKTSIELAKRVADCNLD
jgi:PAS domain S-box-containing protein